jgi:hypothetical protein
MVLVPTRDDATGGRLDAFRPSSDGVDLLELDRLSRQGTQLRKFPFHGLPSSSEHVQTLLRKKNDVKRVFCHDSNNADASKYLEIRIALCSNVCE